MLYSEFLENEYNKLLEVLNEYELKKLNKFHVQKKKLGKFNKSRLNISAKRLNLVIGKENSRGKQKSEKQIRALATKNARRILSKKLLNKNYDDLSSVERIEFSKRKQERKELYQRIVADEIDKLKNKYSGKKSLIKKQNIDKTTKD